MNKKMRCLLVAVIGVLVLFSHAIADEYLESLQPMQKINGFTVSNVYENGAGQAMGARFISDKYGFIIDLMQIQSVPQAFYWIKTLPTSSMGEPHACEHLLLGKGNRGRYVSVLEDMSLANSTAGTGLLRTCYHFNTTAGEDTFYDIFEAKLNAFLHPDFTDEEIQREVCHLGVTVDPQDSSLDLEEKGSVYTEMVSSFEKPWYYYGGAMNKLVFGENHPLAQNSGGNPAVMRNMTPADMRTFHKDTHHLSNMGTIISIPDNIQVADCLLKMNEILQRCQEGEDSSPTPGILGFDFPPPESAPAGTITLNTYPSEKVEDPGYTIFAWPPDVELDAGELARLELFMEAFASGQTSNLYNVFINSQTQRIDLGGNAVWGGIDTEQGVSIYFGLTAIDNSHVNEAMLDSVRSLIVGEFRRIHDFADGSDELREFNDRIRNRMIENKKQIEKYLNSPPMFGFRRGSAWGWLGLMTDLERESGFRKSLVFKERFAEMDSLLNLERNFWSDEIDRWRVLTVPAYAVGAAPSAERLVSEAEAKEQRLAAYIEDFKQKYGVADKQAALAKYKQEFDAKTAELEAIAADAELPGFLDNPPMTLDEQLKYETIMLPGNIPLVASTFNNMSSSRIDLALRMDVVPESLLVYVPFIPDILTGIGAVKDGDVVPYDKMRERLRREVLSLGAYYDTDVESERVELVLSGQGSNLDELKNALGWMDAALYTPYLSEENLPRMMDVIDQSLISYRNMMKRSEEAWVNYPANGYRRQTNPLFMSTNCFLTETHHLQRLKWQLSDPGNDEEQAKLVAILEAMAEFGRTAGREDMLLVLDALEKIAEPGDQETQPDLVLGQLNVDVSQISTVARNHIVEIARLMKVTLDEIPDANLAQDWAYLCRETKADLLTQPEVALDQFNAVLDLIRQTGNARTVMISNQADREATRELVEGFVGKLRADSPVVRQSYTADRRIVNRLRSREPEMEQPLYVGLVNESTRNGVLIFSTEHAGPYDTSRAAAIDCLTGKLYSGGGGHSIFMKTWAAGLAYSNGYRYYEASGRIRYYAERCPDVAETMRFVVNILNEAEDNSQLVDYATALVFNPSRAPSRYESRGLAMAADLVDDRPPEMVAAFRQKVLDLKGQEGLYEQLKSRMQETYGPVLIGYGPPLSESKDGNFFLIGPEPQFESLEELISTTEGPEPVYRLYPRDFWLVTPPAP